MSLRNKKIHHDYDISISIVMESEDIEEVTEYADALMESIRGETGISAADWYNITPIRQYKHKKESDNVKN